MSYTPYYFHWVIVTKYRALTLSPLHDEELYSYIGGILKNNHFQPIKINGTANHIHILAQAPSAFDPSKMVGEIKRATSFWMGRNPGKFPHFAKWSHEYGGFTVSENRVESLKQYIANQKEHHKFVTFETEYFGFLSDSQKQTFRWDYFDT